MHLIKPKRNRRKTKQPIRIYGCHILMVIAWWFVFGEVIGQPLVLPEFKQQVFNTSNGLSNNNIRVITKDKTGYLWIGTANGLSRFDGHYFTNFFHTPGDSNSIAHNFIQGIICDAQGKIWILHVLGMSLYNPETQYFTNFPIQQDYPHFSGAFISFTDDGSGNIWIGNQNGLAIFNKVKSRYFTLNELNAFIFRKDNGFAGNSINGIVRGEKGQIWLNTFSSLFNWNPDKKETREINVKGIGGANSSLAINYADTAKGVLYIGSFNKGLFLFYYKTLLWEQFLSGPESLSTDNYDPVRCLQPFEKNMDAYISELGIGFFEKASRKLVPLKPVPLGNEQAMLCLFTDSNHIWAGTDNGLFLLTQEKIKPENITPKIRNQGAFNTVQVHPDQPIIFSGNYALPTVYQMPSSGGMKTDLKNVKGFLRYYFKDSKGNEWVSTETEIYRKIAVSGIWKKVPVKLSVNDSYASLPRNFAEDRNGDMWVRIRNAGICIYDSIKQAFVQHSSPPLPDNSIYSGLIFNTVTNTLWLSEEKTGLYALALNTEKWEHHPLQLASTPLTPARIVAGKNGNIAFPDPFNGIGFYDPETKKLKLISQKEGLLSNNVSSIDTDTDGNFWTYSTEGISKVMASDLSVVNYREPNLVKIQEIACGNDGMVYVAAAEGLYRFNGNLLTPVTSYGTLQISKVEIMGKPYPFTKNFSLPPGMSDIQIQFSYIDLYSGIQPAFEYRFEKDKEWTKLGNRNLISFSRLSPGDYKITIRERHDNNPAQWQSLSWTIEKPFWQRIWFLALLLVSLGSGIYFFTQKRISSIREKASLKQKISETEMAALRAQMNPHFIFNSINCIDAMVQDGDKYNATTYLNKFAKLIRNVLDGSRTNTVSLQTDIKTLEWYIELEHMRMDGNFDWKITMDDSILQKDIKVPSLIIQPYVENAILHGLRHLTNKKGLLEITIFYKDGSLFYSIKDNGVGRAFSKQVQKTQHSSYGMEITENRIKLANPDKNNRVEIIDLKHEDGTAAGTQVNVTLHLS